MHGCSAFGKPTVDDTELVRRTEVRLMLSEISEQSARAHGLARTAMTLATESEENMSEKERKKKDGRRKDKDLQAMRENSSPRREQASVRFGEQKRAEHTERRRGERNDYENPATQ